MKFIAIRSNIKDAISVIEKAVGENSNLPILKNILIEAEGGNITFTATNLEIKENNLEIATDNYNAVINGMSAEDFPITPKIKNTESYIEIKNAFLREAIQQVTVASQYSDLRPELNSLLFNFS